MITSKRRAELRAHANKLEVVLQVGKSGIIPTVVKQAVDALAARELIKGKVLENSFLTARSVAQDLAERTDAEIVQVIGTKFVLYKRNPKDPKFD